jgi:hypothetical protein
MKTTKLKWLCAALVAVSGMDAAIAQQIPTNTSPAGAGPSGQNNAQFWSRAGNSAVGGTNNIFGTLFNSPIFTVTNNARRMRLNGDATYSVNGWNQQRNGYLLLGLPGTGVTNHLYNTANFGAFSLLHLNGGASVQEFGFRPWMQTGITFTSNNDLAYIGHKSNGNDITDFICAWSDNGGNGGPGPDVMKFVFTTGSGVGGSDLIGNNLDGREIMRMTGYGNVGIGPRFNNNNQPQSQLHMGSENSTSNWLQITNQGNGQPYSPNDGLRVGILGDNNPTYNGYAMVYNQENKPLLFSNNNATNATFSGGTLERMRVSSAGTPTLYSSLATSFNPVPINPNPGAVPTNRTRVSVSADPNNPVTRPLTLMHLGYNAGQLSTTVGSTDGWRRWMDVGTFTSSGSDAMYVGLKQETSPIGDRWDAVINWSDNEPQTLPPGSGPDNLRFIFTSTQSGTGTTAPANGADGVEGMRMTPVVSPNNQSHIFTGVGGDPTVNAYTNGIYPNNTLEVNSYGSATTPGGSSGLRFTDLNSSTPTVPNPGQGVLSVDANGDVIYVPGGGTPSTGTVNNAQNGTSIVNAGTTVELGLNPLLHNTEVPLSTFNMIFSGQGGAQNVSNVGIGQNNANSFLQGKLDVYSENEPIGILSVVDGSLAPNSSNQVGVRATVNNATSFFRFGVQGLSFTNTPGSGVNVGVEGNAQGDAFVNYGVSSTAQGNATQNVGIYAQASGGTFNAAVYGDALSNTANFAGYFNGNVFATGTITASDANLKTNIDSIGNALAIIDQLQPKKFNYNTAQYPGFNLPTALQYGLIAQDVEQVLPELVTTNIHPAKFDSAGNVVNAAVNYKGLNYTELVPILIQAVKEQQQQIIVQNQQIAALQAQVSGCCANTTARTENTTISEIELGGDVVVLEQNVPNPFADETAINFYVPESAGKAQILFYNSAGQIVKTFDVQQKGKGQLRVFASNLANGMYSYSLVVDGQTIDTKRMIKQ